MKRNILLMICFAMTSIVVMNAQDGIVALHHSGKLTLYSGANIQEAVYASAKGDTLHLSEGLFSGFLVPHGIVVLGTGEKTIVTSDINITGQEQKGDYVFSGLNIQTDFIVGEIIGLKINQCQMRNFTAPSALDEAEISMSYIKDVCFIATHVRKLVVTNSKINRIQYGGNTPSASFFYHCNIRNLEGGNPQNNAFQNCIIMDANAGICVNTLYNQSQGTVHTFAEGTIIFNSWQCDDLELNDDLECRFSDAELQARGYIGTDGTVVGITGGTLPYTLEMSTPRVVESSMEVDKENRTLKVTLKTAEEAN